MEQSEIINLAGELFKGKLDQDGDGLDMADIQKALGQLLSDDKGSLNFSSLLSNMNMGSLMSIAASWLGDGKNDSISSSQLSALLDSDKLSAFASQLGLSKNSALSGLTEALPAMVDKSSSGGSLLDSVGGLDGVLSLAGKIFGK